MSNFLYALVPITMILAHYVGLHFDVKNKKFKAYIRAFAAGFSIGYVFLFLLPEAAREELDQTDSFVLTLFGFTFFHAALTFIFQHGRDKRKIIFIEEIHLATVGIYNFLLSFTLIEIMREDLYQGLLFILILAIHHMLSDLSHKDMHIKKIDTWKSIVIAISNIVGAAVAVFLTIPKTGIDALFSLAAGTILYITVREELPKENEGKPLLFVVGVLLVTMIVLVGV